MKVARSIVKRLYVPKKNSHKGENGKLLIVGGSREYHGAAMLSILAARRFVDLIYFYPGERDPYLMNNVKTIPEVIVVNKLDKLDEMDSVLFGIGLGNSKASIPKPKNKNTKLIIDGDGLKRIKERIPSGAILTPHGGEFRALFGVEGNKSNVMKMAKKHQCVILKKGPIDLISNGTKIATNTIHNQGMTKGGTGDVLAGLIAAFACKNDAFVSTIAGVLVAGNAGNMLKKKYGYNYCASDVADELTSSYIRFSK